MPGRKRKDPVLVVNNVDTELQTSSKTGEILPTADVEHDLTLLLELLDAFLLGSVQFLLRTDVAGLTSLNDQWRAALQNEFASTAQEVHAVIKCMETIATTISIGIRGVQLAQQAQPQKALEEYQRAAKAWGKSRAKLEATLREHPSLRGTEVACALYALFSLNEQQQSVFAKTAEAALFEKQGDEKSKLTSLHDAARIARHAITMPLPPSKMAEGLRIGLATWADIIDRQIASLEARGASTDGFLLPKGDKVLIIHGHGEGKWRELRDLLEGELGLKTVVVADEPSLGKALIDKFEQQANECRHAFAVFTPDDEVKNKEEMYHQARPNVLFELGWFAGRYGRHRVTLVKKKGTSIPSDLLGVVHLEFHDHVSERMLELRNELAAAGVIQAAGMISAGRRRAGRRLAGPRASFA